MGLFVAWMRHLCRFLLLLLSPSSSPTHAHVANGSKRSMEVRARVETLSASHFIPILFLRSRRYFWHWWSASCLVPQSLCWTNFPLPWAFSSFVSLSFRIFGSAKYDICYKKSLLALIGVFPDTLIHLPLSWVPCFIPWISFVSTLTFPIETDFGIIQDLIILS